MVETITSEELIYIIMNSETNSLFDQAEAHLRSRGRNLEADLILKLQQDAGLEMSPDFDPDDISDAPGPKSRELQQNYEPLTRQRFTKIMELVNSSCKNPSVSNDHHPKI